MLPMANNNNNTMGQLVVMTRADLDALLQDAIAASRSLVPEPVKEELLPTMADEYVTRQQAAKILHLDVSSLWRLEKSNRLLPCRVSDRRVLYRKAINYMYYNPNNSIIAQNTTFGYNYGYNCSCHVRPSDFIIPSTCISSRSLRTRRLF